MSVSLVTGIIIQQTRTPVMAYQALLCRRCSTAISYSLSWSAGLVKMIASSRAAKLLALVEQGLDSGAPLTRTGTTSVPGGQAIAVIDVAKLGMSKGFESVNKGFLISVRLSR